MTLYDIWVSPSLENAINSANALYLYSMFYFHIYYIWSRWESYKQARLYMETMAKSSWFLHSPTVSEWQGQT